MGSEPCVTGWCPEKARPLLVSKWPWILTVAYPDCWTVGSDHSIPTEMTLVHGIPMAVVQDTAGTAAWLLCLPSHRTSHQPPSSPWVLRSPELT